MKIADTSIESIFGKIKPPPGPSGLNEVDPVVGLSRLIVVSIQIFLFVAGMVLLMYLFWGAYDWIISEGDKEKLGKARSKITNAIIGILIIALTLSIFILLTGNVLGIIIRTNEGFKIKLPTLEKNTSTGGGGSRNPAISF